MDTAGARFADGKSAKILVVTLVPDESGLTILDEMGEPIASWPYDEIRLIGGQRTGQPAVLRLLSDEAARLSLDNDSFLPRLKSFAPDLMKDGVRDPYQWRRAGAWIVGLVLLFTALGFGISGSAPLVAAMLPISVEEQLGEATMEQVALIFGGSEDNYCRGRAGRKALEAVTARLKAVDDSPYTFRVKVVDVAVPNALAAPGGYILIFRGLLDIAESPDEVTGVLGHEMAHVTRQHSMTNLVRAMGFEALIVPLISGGTVASDMLGDLGQMALNASFSREAEAEADIASVELLQRAGIRAGEFPKLLLRIEEKYGLDETDGQDEDIEKDADAESPESEEFSIFDIISSHPATAERAVAVAAAAGDGGGPSMTDEEWRALKSICDRR